MSRVRSAAFAIVAIAAGCAKPIPVQMLTADNHAAIATFRLTHGDKPAVPDQCEMPCTTRIAPGTTNDVVVKAPGYYPASFQLTYDAAQTAKVVQNVETPRLLVPLKARPVKVVAGAPPATAADGASAAERLGNLADLKRQGLISDEEYSRRRAAVLDEQLGR